MGIRRLRRVLRAALLALAAVTLALTACESPLRTAVKTLTGAYASINDEAVVYVDGTNGDDENPGTADLPKKTIQSAIDFVSSFLGTGTVRIRNGTYSQTDTLTLKKGVSLEGGYKNGWVRQDLVNGNTLTIVKGKNAATGAETVITAKTESGMTSATKISGISFEAGIAMETITLYVIDSSPTFQYCLVSGNGGIRETVALVVLTQNGMAATSSPVFNGCYIEGGVCYGDTYAVQVAGLSMATFDYCVIVPNTTAGDPAYGGSASSSTFGIYANGSEVDLRDTCIVDSYAGGASQGQAIGIYSKNGILNLERSNIMGGKSGKDTIAVWSDKNSGYIRNCTIYGGKGTSTSNGIVLMATSGAQSPYIRNCTINGGAGTGTAYGICSFIGGPIIENCLLWSDNVSTSSFGVAMIGSGGNEVQPSALNNCDWFSTTYPYGYGTGGSITNWRSVSSVQSTLGSAVSTNNIESIDPQFVSSTKDIQGTNWALTSSTPSSVSIGGKNLSSLFTDDKAGERRPSSGSWSIGAYQYP